MVVGVLPLTEHDSAERREQLTVRHCASCSFSLVTARPAMSSTASRTFVGSAPGRMFICPCAVRRRAVVRTQLRRHQPDRLPHLCSRVPARSSRRRSGCESCGRSRRRRWSRRAEAVPIPATTCPARVLNTLSDWICRGLPFTFSDISSALRSRTWLPSSVSARKSKRTGVRLRLGAGAPAPQVRRRRTPGRATSAVHGRPCGCDVDEVPPFFLKSGATSRLPRSW